jgi:hypothetical protein
MPRARALFSVPEASCHMRSSAASTTITSGFRFSVHTVALELELPATSFWYHCRPRIERPSTGRLPLQSAHSICYPLMEVRRAHDGLYPGKPHIVSDNVAHTRESEGDTLAL